MRPREEGPRQENLGGEGRTVSPDWGGRGGLCEAAVGGPVAAERFAFQVRATGFPGMLSVSPAFHRGAA